jgi:hypothetical protein
MEFRQINIKTGKELPLPPKSVENTYLEQKFGNELDPTKLAIGRMYDGITERDIENLKEQGMHIILASGRTAYFADREIAAKVPTIAMPSPMAACQYPMQRHQYLKRNRAS